VEEAIVRNPIGVLCLLVLFVSVIRAKPPQQAAKTPDDKTGDTPSWAYGFTTPAGPRPTTPNTPPAAAAAAAPAQPDNSPKQVPGSTLTFTRAQIGDRFGPADWYPGDHPAMPDVVAHGRKPDVWACGLCHYPNGKGRPENADVAGLPVSYFVQTMADFKNGARKSTDWRKANTNNMIGFAKAMSDDEIKTVAQYFAGLQAGPWIKVVETDTVPKTRVNGGMFLTLEGSEREPIGQRIIEVPEKTEATEVLRDAHSGFIAYAPMGSIKKGEALVTNGAGKTTACGVCHGANLQGLGPVPGIAGRSPSYLGRQLYDMQQGSRNGVWSALMKPVVVNLTNDDIVAIVAYLASRGGPAVAASSAPSPIASPAASPVTASSTGGDSLVAQGRARYESYKCYDCHGKNGEGTDDAPDLVGTHLDAAGIAKFLQKPSADADGKGMPTIAASSPDLQPLVAYVMSIKSAPR